MLKNLGLSTSYFGARGLSIYESIDRAYKLGFRLIELGANHEFEKNITGILQKVCQKFPDVTFTQHCCFPPVLEKEFFSNPAEGLTADNKKVLEAMFTTAKILGTKIISFHNGHNSKFIFKGRYKQFSGFKEFVPTEPIPSKQALLGLREFTYFALKKAEKLGIVVAIENIVGAPSHPATLTGLADFKAFLHEFPSLYFLLDFGHAFIAYKTPFQFFSLKERIIEMHLDDVTSDKLDHRVLGSGILNLDDLFSKIKKLPKMPFLILEHSGEVGEDEILQEVKLVEKHL